MLPRQVAHTSVTAPNEHWRQSLRPTVIATPNNQPASDPGNKPRRVLAGALFCAAAPILRVTVRRSALTKVDLPPAVHGRCQKVTLRQFCFFETPSLKSTDLKVDAARVR